MANRRRLIADGAPSLHITHPMCQHDNHDEYDDEDDDDHAADDVDDHADDQHPAPSSSLHREQGEGRGLRGLGRGAPNSILPFCQF